MTIRFFVQGIPRAMSVGKAVRVPNKGGGFRQFQTRRNTDWAVVVGEIGRKYAPPTPLTGALIFMAMFYLPKPASIPRREAATAMPIRRPDLENLMHKFVDHWNGVFWIDDSQITDWFARKRYPLDGRTGVEITVAPVTNTQLMAILDQAELDMEPAGAHRR
jgi:Holliday junction resolvase RusA-like endonuclease